MYRIDLDGIDFHEEKNLYIIGGVHGSGKSTFCRSMLEIMKVPYVTPEELRKELPANITQTHLFKQLRKHIDQLLDSGQSFYFEHVMSGNYVGKLISRAKEHNFRIHAIYIDIDSVDIAQARINKRVKQEGHDVEYSLIYPRLIESRENFKEKYSLMADYWAIFDNSMSRYTKISES